GDDARQAALLGRGGAARAACHQNRHNEHGERQDRRNPSRAYHQDSFVIETLYQLDAGIIARVALRWRGRRGGRSEEHTSELQSRENLVCRLLLEKKNKK